MTTYARGGHCRSRFYPQFRVVADSRNCHQSFACSFTSSGFFFLRGFFSGPHRFFIINCFGNIIGKCYEASDGYGVEAEVWVAYRAVCSREKLRPSSPIEEFLRLVLEND